jgi:hypothetical protein
MGKRVMSEETKAKIAATRAAKQAAVEAGEAPATTRATVEEQLAAAQAAADAGDRGAQEMMPVLGVYAEQMAQCKADYKTAARKLRKALSILK